MGDHRIERARERYGLNLTGAQIKELERRICVENRLRKRADGGVHAIDWHGELLIVGVIDREYPIITTFLPPDMFSSGHQRAWRGRGRKLRRKEKHRFKPGV